MVAKALLVHPIAQAVDHVFDDAEAVVHGRRADLHGAAAQQNELRRIAPAGDAADAGDRQRRFRIAADLLHHVQRDRLHRGAAVAAVRRLAVRRRAAA